MEKNKESVRPEGYQAYGGDTKPDKGGKMRGSLFPLFHKYNEKQGGHREVDTGGIKGQEFSGGRAEAAACDPVQLVE